MRCSVGRGGFALPLAVRRRERRSSKETLPGRGERRLPSALSRRRARTSKGLSGSRIQRRRGRPTRVSEGRHDIPDVDINNKADVIVGSVSDHLQFAVGSQVRILALDCSISQGLLLRLFVKSRRVLDLPCHSVGRIRVSIIRGVEGGSR